MLLCERTPIKIELLHVTHPTIHGVSYGICKKPIVSWQLVHLPTRHPVAPLALLFLPSLPHPLLFYLLIPFSPYLSHVLFALHFFPFLSSLFQLVHKSIHSPNNEEFHHVACLSRLCTCCKHCAYPGWLNPYPGWLKAYPGWPRCQRLQLGSLLESSIMMTFVRTLFMITERIPTPIMAPIPCTKTARDVLIGV